MGFLSGLFKKKPGGTFFGNLLRAGASMATGGVLGSGANKIEHGQTATNAEIAKDPTKAQGNYVSPLTGQQISFAGQPAVKEADGTIAMQNSLSEVTITPKTAANNFAPPVWLQKLGDMGSYLGKRSTEQTAVGVDNKTLMVVGGGLFALVLVMMLNKK